MYRKTGFLVAIVVCQLIFSLQADARTIFIDGWSFGKTFKIEQGKEKLQRVVGSLGLTPEKREVSYLYKSDLGKEILNKDPEGRAIVPWNGDALNKAEVDRAIDATIKTIKIIHDKDEKINIISHSYGTMIAYDALKILANPEENKERLEGLDIKVGDLKDKHIEINTLITMGSPLSGRRAYDKDLKFSEEIKVTNWLNYYGSSDRISGEIKEEGVMDIQVIGDHFSYYKNPIWSKTIASGFANPEKAEIYAENSRNIYTQLLDFKQTIVPHESYANSTPAIIQQSTQQSEPEANNLIKFCKTLPTGLPYGQISPELAKKINDERTSQQLLTPVSISFTTTFDGLLTQSADSLGSLGGNHSGTITAGTRVGTGSRPGDFTGSFSGRTIAETGFTPATHNNAPFSGTSVGTATARGFQEGDLKGSMTVTVPAGAQTATVSGSITINADGSSSMPSYSGPITVDATGQKVGTISGSWSQGATQ